MNDDRERALKHLLAILTGDDPRQTSLPEARRPSGNLARYDGAPRTFWQRLFGDPYSRGRAAHEYKRFAAELTAETESHKLDIDHALELKRIKQEVERDAYAHQAEVWREVEQMANEGMGDITRASKFRELVDLVESLGFEPLQQQHLISLLYRRFHAKQEENDDDA
jgi:hypothetical protein